MRQLGSERISWILPRKEERGFLAKGGTGCCGRKVGGSQETGNSVPSGAEAEGGAGGGDNGKRYWLNQTGGPSVQDRNCPRGPGNPGRFMSSGMTGVAHLKPTIGKLISVKRQRVSISGFAGHMVCAAAPGLRPAA